MLHDGGRGLWSLISDDDVITGSGPNQKFFIDFRVFGPTEFSSELCFVVTFTGLRFARPYRRPRSGPRTEPLGSRRTGFGSWIPGYNDVGDGRYSRNMLVWDVGDRISVSIAKVIWCCPLNLTMKVRFLLLAIFISHHKNPWLMGSIVQTCIFTVE